MIEKLKLHEFKLQSLLDITKGINENYSVSKLLDIYKYILRDQLGISRLMLYNKGEDWSCILKYGSKAKSKDIKVEEDLIRISEITVIESSSKNTLNSFDVVIPVFHKEQALAYLLIGDLDEEEIRISPTIKHMPFIQTLTNIIVVAIENKRFANESIKQERAKRELEVASEMQKMLFPTNMPSNENLEIAGHYRTQQLVGGDYYDYIRLNKEEFIICMADVSGKGVSAAMLMSNFQANVRAIFNYNNFRLHRLIAELNTKVMEAAQGEKFITFFVAKYNSSTRDLHYINAGHNHPILTDGENARMLGTGCTGLGMFDEIPSIKEEFVTVDPNSTLILFTDGLVELENEDEESYETDRLIDLLHSNYLSGMDEFNTLVFDELEKFKGANNFIDDTAILSCRFK
jgi:sigma-B regulation protein RsbU (phosphoserine phosphatase)